MGAVEAARPALVVMEPVCGATDLGRLRAAAMQRRKACAGLA